jgi:hypothetical protein
MTRTFAFFAAVLLTTVTVTSSCFANSPNDLRFKLQGSEVRGDQVTLQIRSGQDERHNGMTSTFRSADLAGFDPARLNAGGPLSFALVREAGRVDCSGNASGGTANGACRFTPDAAFSSYLVSSGVRQPTLEQSYDMTLIGVHRELIGALKAAKYPMPTIDEFIELSAVGVTPGYIADLSRGGYRPRDLDKLVEYRAVGVTPEYLGAMARAGYDLSVEDAVEFAALNISPEYMKEFERIGYRVPRDDLVEFKALGITPEFVQSFERIGYRNLPSDTLVELKALQVTPEFVNQVRQSLQRDATLEQIVQLKAIGFDEMRR